jgi:cell division protein FtsQ
MKHRKPYRIKKKKSVLKSRFFWLGVLVLMIFGGIFYLICFSSPFQIKEIKISGNEKVSFEDIQKITEEKIKKKILFFSTRSIFLADFQEINKVILERFPRVAQVSFKRDFPDVIIADIEERKPLAVFCQNDNCFFIDKEGIIFETNVTRQGLVTLSKKDTGLEVKLGEKVIDETLLSQILEIESKLKEYLKIPLEEVLIVSDERINAKTSQGWEIYFNPKGDLNWQLTKLNAVLEEEIPEEQRNNLEYIELRFGNFAPYKYRD